MRPKVKAEPPFRENTCRGRRVKTGAKMGSKKAISGSGIEKVSLGYRDFGSEVLGLGFGPIWQILGLDLLSFWRFLANFRLSFGRFLPREVALRLRSVQWFWVFGGSVLGSVFGSFGSTFRQFWGFGKSGKSRKSPKSVQIRNRKIAFRQFCEF